MKFRARISGLSGSDLWNKLGVNATVATIWGFRVYLGFWGFGV